MDNNNALSCLYEKLDPIVSHPLQYTKMQRDDIACDVFYLAYAFNDQDLVSMALDAMSKDKQEIAPPRVPYLRK